jgi:hypothetical protein
VRFTPVEKLFGNRAETEGKLSSEGENSSCPLYLRCFSKKSITRCPTINQKRKCPLLSAPF